MGGLQFRVHTLSKPILCIFTYFIVFDIQLFADIKSVIAKVVTLQIQKLFFFVCQLHIHHVQNYFRLKIMKFVFYILYLFLCYEPFLKRFMKFSFGVM
jgi:hypothetical protein